MIKEFQTLPYKHKAVLASESMPEFVHAYQIKNCEAKNGGLIDICCYQSKFTGKRWLDEFDYVAFLNDMSND